MIEPVFITLAWVVPSALATCAFVSVVYREFRKEGREQRAQAREVLQEMMREVRAGTRTWTSVVEPACLHGDVRFLAATVAEPLPDGVNVTVGVVARCDQCGKAWAGEVRPRLARPYR